MPLVCVRVRIEVREDYPTHPELSYGAHKLVTEVLLADYSRRGELDGLALLLPGIVARPPSPTGHDGSLADLAQRATL